MPTRVYIQSEHFPDVKLIEVDDHATIEELKRAVLALLPQGTDSSELSLSVEDDEDNALGNATHVKHLKKEHGVRVHLHRCKHVDVHVRFNGQTVGHPFLPATTVGRVRAWAGHKLGMTPGDIAEHVLQIDGTNVQPDIDVHVGSLTKCPQCSVTFDLVPAHRVNG
jgi:hypothetical protein